MTPLPSRAASSEGDVPRLRGLGPEYDEKLHGRHAEVLLKVLSDDSPTAAKNIALSGHYGSGKSSVILGVQAGLERKKIEWVNLSLSSLGIDDTKRARVQADGTLAPLTNLIQKEIVKQLLYRKAPADMPGSRYVRIDSFRAGRAVQWSIAVATGVFIILVLFGLADRVERVAPKALVDDHAWVPWLTVGLLGALMGAVCFLALRGLQSPVRVDSVSAGGAAVSLSAKENSYFDEYLDEIVYFFQQTKTKVAIFEDLDRFKDPHIFETLRELNTVLNNSEQVKVRPVRFVYAVRDSIFEQLDVSGELAADPVGANASALRAAAQESVPSANRTKFFDLVVPMVPFLTHRSARDLLAAEFEDAQQKPSTALLNLVGGDRALTDMRLIRNIRNEFEIYRASVLSAEGLQGLTADRLFAMMVYKNTHLEDFEAIRLGTSKIDAAHRAFRDMAEYQVTHQAARSRAALEESQGRTLWDERAKAVGERLQQVLPVVHRANRRASGEPYLILASDSYPMSNLTSGELWKTLYETRESVELGQPGSYTTTVSFDELVLLAGEAGLALQSGVEADVSALQRRSRLALATKELVTRATMSELMARTDLKMPGDGGEKRSLDEIVSAIVSPLARDLLAAGYIDENFTLYCSDYHGVAISVSAMNFILHCVQADRADPLFRFDDPSSIDAVAEEIGERFLGGESVFNVEVFNHYLTTGGKHLANALDRLAVRAEAGDTSFLGLFLDTAEAKSQLLCELAPRWTGLFVYLVEAAAPDDRTAFVDTAIRNAVNGVDYATSDSVSTFIEEHQTEIVALTEQVDEAAATSLVLLLRKLRAQIPKLADLGEAQRRAVVAAGLYPVTRANLLTALGATSKLALDTIREQNNDVYDHVIANLADYLNALQKGEATVEDPGKYLEVLGHIVGAPEQLVRTVAELATESCQVGDLDELDPSGWNAVVSAGRFRTSASNVSRYVNEHGVTPELARVLARRSLTQPDSIEAGAKGDLAYALIEADALEIGERVRLVSELEVPNYLDPSELSGGALSMLPELLEAGEVPDNAETFAFIADRPYSFREGYFSKSKKIASYITELPLTKDDLVEVFKSRQLSPRVKRAIADDANFVADLASQRGAIAICEWAAKGNEVSPDLLLVLSRSDAPAERILGLLEPHLSSIELDALDNILRALGDDYEPLTRTGRQRPRLKARPGTVELLDELQRRHRVSSYSEAKLLGGIKVNMRQ